jgi:hypothetical protein
MFYYSLHSWYYAHTLPVEIGRNIGVTEVDKLCLGVAGWLVGWLALIIRGH